MINPWANMLETLVDAMPSDVGIEARTTRLRRLTGELMASESFDVRWLGSVLGNWLRDGGDLVAMLGGKPDKGSTVTPQSILLRDVQDQLLMRMSRLAGSDAAALEMLRGERPCPDDELHAEATQSQCPASSAAFTRARRRLSRHGV